MISDTGPDPSGRQVPYVTLPYSRSMVHIAIRPSGKANCLRLNAPWYRERAVMSAVVLRGAASPNHPGSAGLLALWY